MFFTVEFCALRGFVRSQTQVRCELVVSSPQHLKYIGFSLFLIVFLLFTVCFSFVSLFDSPVYVADLSHY